MVHLRQKRSRAYTEPIAFVWPDTSPQQFAANSFLRTLYAGAETRARSFGFRLDPFHLKGTGLTATRLDRILAARGIACLLLGPVSYHTHSHLSMRWDRYSAVSIGLGLWRPALHRVHHNHYASMVELIRHLRHQGFRTIGLSVDEEIHRRMFGAWVSAFLSHHPLGAAKAADMIRFTMPSKGARPSKNWKGMGSPELVIFDHPNVDQELSNIGAPPGTVGATLSWNTESAGHAGIDQHTSIIGSHAVDMLIAQFHRAERGVPEHPKVMMAGGRLVAG